MPCVKPLASSDPRVRPRCGQASPAGNRKRPCGRHCRLEGLERAVEHLIGGADPSRRQLLAPRVRRREHPLGVSGPAHDRGTGGDLRLGPAGPCVRQRNTTTRVAIGRQAHPTSAGGARSVPSLWAAELCVRRAPPAQAAQVSPRASTGPRLAAERSRRKGRGRRRRARWSTATVRRPPMRAPADATAGCRGVRSGRGPRRRRRR
jgi:hypothetical protein